jgi:hypothetical protein
MNYPKFSNLGNLGFFMTWTKIEPPSVFFSKNQA